MQPKKINKYIYLFKKKKILAKLWACDSIPMECVQWKNREVGNIHIQRYRFTVIKGTKKRGLINLKKFFLHASKQ